MRISWITLHQPRRAEDRSYTSDLASLRYRVLSPISTLGHTEFRHAIYSLTSDPVDAADPVRAQALDADVMVFSKSLLTSNEDLARRARTAGVKVIFDVCDNHFDDAALGPHYRNMCALADQVTCNSRQMAAIAQPVCRNPVIVIDDPYEGVRRAAHFDPGDRLRLLWFGSSLNLESLNASFGDLVGLSSRRPTTVTLMTQHNETLTAACAEFSERFGPAFTLAPATWSLAAQWDALAACDAVIIPTLDNAKFRAKSANRMVEALWAGRPAVAQPMPAYTPFSEWMPVTEALSEGILRLLNNPADVPAQIDAAQAYIHDRHAPAVLGAEWKKTLKRLVQSSAPHEA